MHKPTFDVDAASILFNLSGYRVVSATPGVGVEQPRQVLIETTTSEGACPSCGVLSSRIQARPTQRVKDVACGGQRLDVLVRKRRYACREVLCPRRSFTEETEQLPARARVTTRLAEQVITACRAEPRTTTASCRHGTPPSRCVARSSWATKAASWAPECSTCALMSIVDTSFGSTV